MTISLVFLFIHKEPKALEGSVNGLRMLYQWTSGQLEKQETAERSGGEWRKSYCTGQRSDFHLFTEMNTAHMQKSSEKTQEVMRMVLS